MLQLLTRSIVCCVIAALLPVVSRRAQACTLCRGFPKKTAADYLIEADCVVLARESEEQPFSYAPLETLQGDYQGDDIELLVDSQTRRRLGADQSRRVVLVRESQSGKWSSLGIATEAYEAVLRRVVLASRTWGGDVSKRRRWEFFLPLFGHDDPDIHQLAYLELGRAPYAVIKKLGRIAKREDLLPLLRDPKYIHWRSLAILLLAQSDNPQDKQLIIDSFRAARRLGMTANLAAWAAAAIEQRGGSAIQTIEDEYFICADKSPEELQAIVQALSMHGSQEDSPQRDRIVASYAALLERSPAFARQVAEDLYAWNRSELVKELSNILTDPSLDIADKQSIRRYLRAASSVEGPALVRD